MNGDTRRFPSQDDHRPSYTRDVDSILHSKAYARIGDKTQVAYLIHNDHVTGRGLHVQFVSAFARGIAEKLRLNSSLVEAIALGHDVGHPPFGHEGERYLSDLSQQHGLPPFCHHCHSCRIFSEIEPLNLCLAVLDGILCHDGGLKQQAITPLYGKSWEDHLSERERRQREEVRGLTPTTLEGCLVKVCDTVSYIGKDIEDAICLGILKREQVPKTILGQSNREILGKVSRDLIENSYEKKHISLSEEVLEALKSLRRFNYSEIYFHPTLKQQSEKIQRGYQLLSSLLWEEWRSCGKESHLWTHFLHDKPKQYHETTQEFQFVVDYLAGMTDSYFLRTLKSLSIPLEIQVTTR